MQVGDRVAVQGKSEGTIRFRGEAKFKEGEWFGVELDEPGGKNDGSVQGEVYFSCKQNHGIFVKASHLTPIPKAVTQPIKQEAPKQHTAQEDLEQKVEPEKSVETNQVQEHEPKEEEDREEEIEEIVESEESEGEELELAEGPDPDSDTKRLDFEREAEKSLDVEDSKVDSDAFEMIEELQAKFLASENLVAELREQLQAAHEQIDSLKMQHQHQKSDMKQRSRSTSIGSEEDIDPDERVADLESQLEMIALDKEMAEHQIEELQRTVSELNAAISLKDEKLKKLNAETSSSGAGAGPMSPLLEASDAQELAKQNAELRAALGKLRDLSMAERQAHLAAKEELDSQNAEMVELRREAIELREKEVSFLHDIDELKATVDDLEGAQKLAEELSERNMKLSDEIAELKSAMEDLEALRDVSEELEENQANVEKQLRAQIYSMEVSALNQEDRILNMKRQLADSSKTVEQFRTLVNAQQSRLKELEQKESELTQETSQLMTSSQSLMEQNLQLQTKAHKNRASILDSELVRLELQQAKENLNFLTAVMPFSLLVEDAATMQVYLLWKRIERKCAIVMDFHVVTGPTDHFRNENERELALHKLFFLAHQAALALENCEEGQYVRAGEFQSALEPVENALDIVINYLKEEKDLKEALARLFGHLSTVEEVVRKMFSEGHPIVAASNIHDQCNSLRRAMQRLQALNQTSAPRVANLNYPVAESRAITTVCAKIIHNLEAQQQIPEKAISKISRAALGAEMLLKTPPQLLIDGTDDVDPIVAGVKEIYKEIASVSDDWHLFSDVGKLVETDKEIRANVRKVRTERIKSGILESAGLGAQLEEARYIIQERDKAILAAQKTLEEVKQESRVREAALQSKVSSVNSGENKLQIQIKEAEEARSQLAKNYDDIIFAMKKTAAGHEEEVQRGRVRALQLEGKVDELIAIIARQKKQILSQDSSIPIRMAEQDIAAYKEAIKFLVDQNALLKAKNSREELLHLFGGSAMAPVLSSKAAWDTNRDTKLANNFIHKSLHLLASPRIVRLGKVPLRDLDCVKQEELLATGNELKRKLQGLFGALPGTVQSEEGQEPIATENVKFFEFPDSMQLKAVQRQHKGLQLAAKVVLPSPDERPAVAYIIPEGDLSKIHRAFAS